MPGSRRDSLVPGLSPLTVNFLELSAPATSGSGCIDGWSTESEARLRPCRMANISEAQATYAIVVALFFPRPRYPACPVVGSGAGGRSRGRNFREPTNPLVAPRQPVRRSRVRGLVDLLFETQQNVA